MQSGDRYTTIDIPGHAFTVPYGINTAGQIVGYYADSVYPGLINHGFLLSGGNLTIIDVPGSTSTSAFGISDGSEIVGSFQDARGEHGFVLVGGQFTTVDVPGAISTAATGVNNTGQIVGTHQFGDSLVHSFLLVDDHFTAIDVPGAWYTVAHGINDAGVIVGEFIDGSGNHGFILRDGHYMTIDVPDSGSFTSALGINTSGQIVGAYTDFDLGRTHGYLATPAAVDKIPPIITVTASPATLSPPNGRLVPVTVSGTITDGTNGFGVQASTCQVIDEYGQIQPSGSVPLVNGGYSFTVTLQASRRGNDQDGRHYTIAVSARDNAGNLGRALATVTVPRN